MPSSFIQEERRTKLLKNKAPRLTESEQLSMSAAVVMVQLCRPPVPRALPAPPGPSLSWTQTGWSTQGPSFAVIPPGYTVGFHLSSGNSCKELDLLRNCHCLLELVGCSPGWGHCVLCSTGPDPLCEYYICFNVLTPSHLISSYPVVSMCNCLVVLISLIT